MKARLPGPAVRIALIYAVLSVLWIVFSDRLVVLLFPDPALQAAAQTYKGLVFVIATALLVYGLLHRELRRRERIEDTLRDSEQRYRQTLLASPNPIFLINREGRISTWNPAFFTALQYGSDIAGRPYVQLLADPEQVEMVGDMVRSVFEDGAAFAGADLRFRCRDGSQRLMLSRLYPLRDLRGRVQECVFASTDLTERQQAEEALRQSEDRFFKAFHTSPDAIAINRLSDGVYINVNEGFTTLTGYSVEEVLDRSSLEINIWADPQDRARLVEDLTARGETQGLEARFRLKDGTVRTGLMSARLIDVGGEPCILSITRDISERKAAEDALRESQQTLATLMANLQGMAYRCCNDDQWTMIFVSEGAAGLTGYPPDDLIENRRVAYVDLIHPEDRQQVRKTVQAAVREDRPFELSYRIRTQDGRVRWVWERGRQITGLDGLAYLEGFVTDITERRLAEEQMNRRSRELALLNRIFTAAGSSLNVEEVLGVACREMALTFDIPQSGIALANRERTAYTLIAEYTSRETPSALGTEIPVEGNLSLQYVIEHRQPLFIADARHDPRLAPVHDVMVQRGVASLLIVPLIIRDEVVGTIGLDSFEPRSYTADELVLATNVALAVSQVLHNARLYEELESYNEMLVRAVEDRTEELQRVSSRVEAILNNSPDAILLVRPNGLIDSVNRAFHRLFGLQDDMYGEALSDLVASDSIQPLYRALREVITRRKMVRLEVTARHSDGSTFDCDVALAPLIEESAIKAVCSLRDISALKEAERLKDNFVSNVSHELRTPITSLKLNHRLLMLNPERSEVYISRLWREIERLSVIIEDLLTLSRLDQGRVPFNPEPINLAEVVEQYADDRGPLAESRGLTLTLESRNDLPPVRADAGLIGQVLSILLTNAFNYTPGGGQITVRLDQLTDNGQEWAGFSVSDTGPGIPQDEQERLFERFFRGRAALSTGAPGTGLGLALARQIVLRHGGQIAVESAGVPGEGTTFRVWLPVAGPS